MTLMRRVLPVLGFTALFLVATATAASAHIEPDVTTIPASAPATVGFNVEHGCGDESTTKVTIQVPETVQDAQPVALDGWQSSVTDRVVTFDGGPQPAHEALTISISFTAPDTEGELTFPIIQTCGTTETAWIDTTEDGEHPAPVVTIGPAGSTASTAAAEEESEGGEHSEMTTTTAVGEDPGGKEATEAEAETDGSSSTAPIILGGVVVILVVGITVITVRTRRRPQD